MSVIELLRAWLANPVLIVRQSDRVPDTIQFVQTGSTLDGCPVTKGASDA
jgi:hypothetical protein